MFPRHNTECRRIGISDHSTTFSLPLNFYIRCDNFLCWKSCMWIDQVMVISPLSLGTSTTCEKIILEIKNSDHFIQSKGTFKSYFPSSSTIEISPKVDQISRNPSSIRKILENHLSQNIDEIPLPDSTKFKEDVSMKDDFFSLDFYIAIIPFFFLEIFCVWCRFRISIPEFWESLSYGWIEISIRNFREHESKCEHFLTIRIEYSMASTIKIMQPISFDKSRILFFKMQQSLFYALKKSSRILLCIKRKPKMCANNIERMLLHKKTIAKNSEKESEILRQISSIHPIMKIWLLGMHWLYHLHHQPLKEKGRRSSCQRFYFLLHYWID